MNFKEVERRVDRGLKVFIKEDSFLLEYNLNERTISHKLAVYLQKEFSSWDVDCEYNRNIDRVKKIHPEQISSDDTNAVTVYPDIIVHHRNTTDNLLIIEIKKDASESEKEKDLNKIKTFKNELGYTFGLFIDFKTGTEKPYIREKVWLHELEE